MDEPLGVRLRYVPGTGCEPGEGWCHGDFACEEATLVAGDCPGYWLPTETEWEYAARAGAEGPTWLGPVEIVGLNDAPFLDALARYGGNSGVEYTPAWDCADWTERQRPSSWCGTHPVGRKAANPWGLADVLGNVWEWVWDHDETDRIRRGCSWASIPRHCRVADRSADPPVDRDRNWGFRLVR